MTRIKNYELGIMIVLGLFFLLRLVNLTILPIFADEAIYIRWSQVMRAEPSLRFLPLSDGKQPLFMWLTIPFLKLLKDPLFAGRFLSVLSGFGSLVGLFLLSYELFKDKRLSLIASSFYAAVPFFVFYDRMALVDSMLAMFGIWTFYFGTLLIHSLSRNLAIATGVVLGGALITKSPALFFALLLPTTLLVTPRMDLKKKEKTKTYLKRIARLWLVVYLIAYGIYNLLRLGRNFRMIAIRNKDYVFSFQEIFSHPLDPLKPHLGDLVKWFPNLLTWPVFLLAIAGLFWLWAERKKWREASFLFLLTTVPLLVQSTFTKGFTPRYILFTIWPLIILAAYFFNYLFEKFKAKPFLAAFIILLILIPAFQYNWQLLTNPEKAPLPRKMRSGYLEEWTAGHGIRQIADFIKEKAKTTNVLVGTEGFFGTLPDGLQIYLEKVPRVTIIGVGYPVSQVHQSLINSLVDNEVYLVVNQSRLLIPPEAYGLKLVDEFPKAVSPAGEQDKLLFFEVDREFWRRQ